MGFGGRRKQDATVEVFEEGHMRENNVYRVCIKGNI
jgi:hypothetical protein